MNKQISFFYFCFLCVLAFTASAHDDEPLFNVVNLQTQMEQDIPNDQMTVLLATEHEGSNTANISRDINSDMQWALEVINTYKGVESKTGNYQTWPIYNKQTISGWRSRQEVEIRSENISALTELTGKLQEKLQVRQMNFSPLEEKIKEQENILIEEAMVAFRERIEIIGKHMDQKNYRIVTIHINSGGYQPPIIYERAAMKTLSMDSSSTPAVDAGSSKISVIISGSVQFF